MLILLTALSLVGVILNTYKRRECFWIWMFTNGAWSLYDFKIGAWEQGLLFAVYFVLAIWGAWKWRHKGAAFIWPRAV